MKLQLSARPPFSLQQVINLRLLALKGVGPYAAANLLVILGRYDYVPVDSWAMRQRAREWYGGQRAGEKEVDAAFERWGEWQGLACWCWEWSG